MSMRKLPPPEWIRDVVHNELVVTTALVLAGLTARQAELCYYKCFIGKSIELASELMGVSKNTGLFHWKAAAKYLRVETQQLAAACGMIVAQYYGTNRQVDRSNANT